MTERRRRQTSELKLELEIARVREDAGGAQEKVERKRRGGEAEAGEEVGGAPDSRHFQVV